MAVHSTMSSLVRDISSQLLLSGCCSIPCWAMSYSRLVSLSLQQSQTMSTCTLSRSVGVCQDTPGTSSSLRLGWS